MRQNVCRRNIVSVVVIAIERADDRECEQVAALASQLHEPLVVHVVGLAHAVGAVTDCNDGYFLDRPACVGVEAFDDFGIVDGDRA